MPKIIKYKSTDDLAKTLADNNIKYCSSVIYCKSEAEANVYSEMIMRFGISIGQDTIFICDFLDIRMVFSDKTDNPLQFLLGNRHQPQSQFCLISGNPILQHFRRISIQNSHRLKFSGAAEQVEPVIDKIGIYLFPIPRIAGSLDFDSHIALSP